MDQPRTDADLMAEAHRRASRDAPPPQWRPLYGGLAGAAVFAIPMVFVIEQVSPYALMLNAIVGFALPYFYLQRLQNAYQRAFDREFTALKGMSDPQRL